MADNSKLTDEERADIQEQFAQVFIPHFIQLHKNLLKFCTRPDYRTSIYNLTEVADAYFKRMKLKFSRY